ncbi:hypothetical protein SAMN04515620_14724 [Collimonas sp. OK607]|nr:hypothetical protein SAMN04515620_14724 [Collimonas sp. OK607]
MLLVDQLLDRMEQKGQVDLIEDFAAAIPIEIIGNLLGVPHDEREPLRDWSLTILGALEPVNTEAALEKYECRVNNVPESALETAVNGALKVYQS